MGSFEDIFTYVTSIDLGSSTINTLLDGSAASSAAAPTSQFPTPNLRRNGVRTFPAGTALPYIGGNSMGSLVDIIRIPS